MVTSAPTTLTDKQLRRRGILAKKMPNSFCLRPDAFLVNKGTNKQDLSVGERTRRAFVKYAASIEKRKPLQWEVVTDGKIDFAIRIAVKKNLTANQSTRRELLLRQPEFNIGRVSSFVAQCKKVLSPEVEEDADMTEEGDGEEVTATERQDLRDFYKTHFQGAFDNDPPCDGLSAEEIFLSGREGLTTAQRALRVKLCGRISTRKSAMKARQKDPVGYTSKRSTDRKRQRAVKR